MKKFIQWLAKRFNANIIVEKTIYELVEVPKEIIKYKYEIDSDVLDGDLLVNGNLTVKGKLTVEKEITAYNNKK